MMFKLEGERVVVRPFRDDELELWIAGQNQLAGEALLEAHPIVSGFAAGLRSQARSETGRSIWAFRPRGD